MSHGGCCPGIPHPLALGSPPSAHRIHGAEHGKGGCAAEGGMAHGTHFVQGIGIDAREAVDVDHGDVCMLLLLQLPLNPLGHPFRKP